MKVTRRDVIRKKRISDKTLVKKNLSKARKTQEEAPEFIKEIFGSNQDTKPKYQKKTNFLAKEYEKVQQEKERLEQEKRAIEQEKLNKKVLREKRKKQTMSRNEKGQPRLGGEVKHLLQKIKASL